MTQRQQLSKRNTAKAQAPSRRGNNGNGASTRFSSDHQPQRRRGPDILPRGSIKLLYRTLLEDDGTLEQSLKGDRRFRAQILRGFFAAAKSPRTAILAAEAIADRLEGRPVQEIKQSGGSCAVFYQKGDPPPWLPASPTSDTKDVPVAEAQPQPPLEVFEGGDARRR